MLVLVVNSGSSSIKYRLVDIPVGTTWASGLVERIGEVGSVLIHQSYLQNGPDAEPVVTVIDTAIPTHTAGFDLVHQAFTDNGGIAAVGVLGAVGHRVVHGGSQFDGPVVVDAEVEAAIDDLSSLAPLHNPAHLEGIRSAMLTYPNVPHVVVFDTAFHQTMPPAAYTYAIDRDIAAKHRIRRYGFHGTSHRYVSRTAANFLGIEPSQFDGITLHLGNGASACAIKGGMSVDTSMGLTPLEGLVMGTRSGDIDPAVTAYLVNHAGMQAFEVDALLNKSSGMKGLAGANDLREVHRKIAHGDPAAQLALDVYTRRLTKYIGSYLAVLERADGVVFTGGVGENDPVVRAAAIAPLKAFGMELDPDVNGATRGPKQSVDISAPTSKIRVLVVPTDEEREIAEQVVAVLD
jgi:acetate kinase